jgi:exopolysaccharide biosynthesis predicted pyruvyltransferase EpsI
MKLPLLSIEKFDNIIKLLSNKKIYYIYDKAGNAGDSLIRKSEKILFNEINIQIIDDLSKVDFIVWGGGGNIGILYYNCFKKRKLFIEKSNKLNIPFVILPSTTTEINMKEIFPENVIFFAREKETHKIYPESILSPDMSFLFNEDITKWDIEPKKEFGLFLRKDKESKKLPYEKYSIGDPWKDFSKKMTKTYDDYFELISEYNVIATDRLHFAISSLILGKKTILLANNYFKNQSMYETWLKDLGCLWGEKEMEIYLRC